MAPPRIRKRAWDAQGWDQEVNIGHGLILWPFFHGGDVSVYIYIHHRLDGSLTNDFFRGGL